MIWPFDSRRRDAERLRGLAPGGFVDLHCHLLPGLDDGPEDAAESARMLAGLGALGYSRVAATPHFHHARFRTPAAPEIERLVAGLDGSRAPGAPQVIAGAEIAFDERFLPAVEAGSLPFLGSSRAYLLELPALPGSLPRGFEEAVFRLAARGVTLVLAHAERIPDLQREGPALGALRAAGALTQIDLTSLAGKHGRAARERGFDLIERGEADVVATDAHAASDLPLVERALDELADRDPAALVRLASASPATLLDLKGGETGGEAARHA